MEQVGEADDDMAANCGTGASSGSAVLDRERVDEGGRKYATALDLVGMVIGLYSAELNSLENLPSPNEALIARTTEARSAYATEEGVLRELSEAELDVAIARYHQVIDDLWARRRGGPQ